MLLRDYTASVSLSSAAMTRAELWLLLLIENEQGDRTGHFHGAAAYGAHLFEPLNVVVDCWGGRWPKVQTPKSIYFLGGRSLVLHAQLIQISQAVWLCVRDTFHELAERLTQPVAL